MIVNAHVVRKAPTPPRESEWIKNTTASFNIEPQSSGEAKVVIRTTTKEFHREQHSHPRMACLVLHLDEAGVLNG